jgi:hypothetical protein
LYGYFDETAEAVVRALHEANAAANVRDIARMRAIVRCDLKRVYRRDDSFDMPRWLASELGVSHWKAARWITAGYALDELPLSTAAYERGELSTDQFIELSRFATRATEEKLLPWAERSTPAAIRARADRELRASSEDTKQADKWRSLTWQWDENNTSLSIWGELPADHGAKFIKAVDRLANKMTVTPEDDGDPAEPVTTRDARRADALVAMASASIATDQDPDRATLVVHTDVQSILDGDKNGVLHGGLPLPPEATELVACDSRVQTVLHDDQGGIFHIGSPSYVVPKWLRREVEHRDEHRCTFPNCGRNGFTDVHHIVPWPKGPTELSNLTLLCHAHHRLIHIHKWHVRLNERGITDWFRPDWSPYRPRPTPERYAVLENHHDHELVAEGSGA